MDVTEIVLRLLPALIALFGLAIPVWRSRKQHALRCVHLSPKSMLDVAEEVSQRVQITYAGLQVKNLTLYQFILHNTGLKLLDADSISTPLTWTAPGKVMAAWAAESDPHVELSTQVEDQRVEVRWDLFNQRCKALVKVLCANVSGPTTGTLKAQIRGIPKIEERKIRWVSENELVEQMTQNLDSKNRLSALLSRPLATRGGVRAARYFLAVYVIVAGLFFLNNLLLILEVSRLSFVSWNVAFAFAALAIALRIRNPYAKLMRLHEDNRRNDGGSGSPE